MPGGSGSLGNGGAYDPAYLQSAYDLSQLSVSAGTGKTVAVVDAYDSPTVESNLASYRSYFGLSPCTTANGCFRKVNQSGAAGPYPASNGSWTQEITLDVEMVSAICPHCTIMLVEANSNSMSDLATSVDTAVALGANAVSNSYGMNEMSGETAYDPYYNHPGVTVTASSGDSGYGTQYPAASPDVTAVGGTSLHQATNTGSRDATETAWGGAGSGCSSYEPKPAWQHDPSCAQRTIADVAAVADPNTGVWVYLGGWTIFGGTSVAAPIVAAETVLTGTNSPSDYYAGSAPAQDITSGVNMLPTCYYGYLCQSVPGYDGPTGEGVPMGLAGSGGGTPAPTPGFSISAAPASLNLAAGSGGSVNVALTAANGYTNPVTLSVTGAPSGSGFGADPPAWSAGAASSTLVIPAAAPAGSYGITVTGTGSDGVTETTSVALTVNPAFTLTAGPSSASALSGHGATFTATVNGSGPPVALSVSGLPTGASGTFDHTSLTPSSGGQNAHLTVTPSNTTPPGTYPLTITATGGGTTHSATVTLLVPGFTLNAGSSALTVKRGTKAALVVNVMSVGGYASAVQVQVGGLPGGTQATATPNPVTPTANGVPVTVTLSVAANATTGTRTVTISANGSNFPRQGMTLALTIT